MTFITARTNSTGAQAPRVILRATVTMNNIIVNVSSSYRSNNVTIMYLTAGQLGFAGAKRSTVHAAFVVGQQCGHVLLKAHISTVELLINGLGKTHSSLLNGLLKSGLAVSSVRYLFQLPFNGCRQKKQRRL